MYYDSYSLKILKGVIKNVWVGLVKKGATTWDVQNSFFNFLKSLLLWKGAMGNFGYHIKNVKSYSVPFKRVLIV